MNIVPITLKQANAYVTQYHRHHKACTGCKFCIGVEECGQLVGVAICGRPVSRHLDDGKTLEINRLSLIDYTQYSTLAMLVGAPTATAIGFYAWKAKAENVIKIKQEHPEETKDVPVDLNNISGTS